MAIETLDHVNVRTGRLAESLRFYEQGLGMKVTPVPGLTDFALGAWIVSEDGRPVVHLNLAPAGADFLGEERDWLAMRGSEQVHHIAFRCSDHDGMRARLEAAGAELKFFEVPQIGLRQIFVRDPNDILIELNFLEQG